MAEHVLESRESNRNDCSLQAQNDVPTTTDDGRQGVEVESKTNAAQRVDENANDSNNDSSARAHEKADSLSAPDSIEPQVKRPTKHTATKHVTKKRKRAGPEREASEGEVSDPDVTQKKPRTRKKKNLVPEAENKSSTASKVPEAPRKPLSACGESNIQSSTTQLEANEMKVVTWNVNGLRSVLKDNAILKEYVKAEQPDVLFLNEVKLNEKVKEDFIDVLDGYTGNIVISEKPGARRLTFLS
eukprot:Selendium_serpulae@DN6002_c0_g1_i3.p1